MSDSETTPLRFAGWWPRALLKEHPLRLLSAAALLCLSLPPLFILLHPVAGGLLLAALLLSLDEAFLPVHYRVGDDGVEVRTALRTRRHTWSEFTAAKSTPFGLHLSSPIRRSLHLLVPDEVRLSLEARVKHHLDDLRQEGSPGTGMLE